MATIDAIDTSCTCAGQRHFEGGFGGMLAPTRSAAYAAEMGTQAWFRDPHSYVREMVEARVGNVAWNRGALVRRKIDPVKHAELYFGGASIDWRVLAIGEQGAAEWRPGDTTEAPSAVYPVWRYEDPFSLLEELVEQPVGEDKEICATEGPADEIPKFGQEHRVVITDLPASNLGAGRQILRMLRILQEDNPKCIIHLHGAYSWRVAFGYNLGAADVDPRFGAQKGRVCLPQGKEVPFEHLYQNVQWATVLGFAPSDLATPRNRCIYNIRSAVWAAENYGSLNAFTTRRGGRVDTTSSDAEHEPNQTKDPVAGHLKKKEGDKVVCNTCSVQDKCKNFRDGSVCTLPNAETKSLASKFGTRDAEEILDGLGALMATGAHRLERGLRLEAEDGDIDPKVTTILNSLHAQGVTMAKMLDPSLRGGAKVQVNVGNGGQAAIVTQASPQQLVAGIMRELENKGIPRADITSEMIKNLLAAKVGTPSDRPSPPSLTTIPGEVIRD